MIGAKTAWVNLPSGFIMPENNQYKLLQNPNPTNIRDDIVSDTKSQATVFRNFLFKENVFMYDPELSKAIDLIVNNNYIKLIDMLPLFEHFMELMTGCNAHRWFRQQVNSKYISTQGINYLKYMASDDLQLHESVYNQSFIKATIYDISNQSRESYIKYIDKKLASVNNNQWSTFLERLYRKDHTGKKFLDFLTVIFDAKLSYK